jgi:hypothetical protein
MELTTGQMIDQIKVGQKAKVVSSFMKNWIAEKIYDEKHLCERIVWITNLENRPTHERDLRLNSNVLESKWSILPQYVTFEEAMKALKEGKSAWFHLKENERLSVNKGGCMSWFDRCTWEELLEGKWSIEN